MMRTVKTRVKDTQNLGRGVFAAKDFRTGELIEASPVILLPKDEPFQQTVLMKYVFKWFGPNDDCDALALGVGSLFNHDGNHNVTYKCFWEASEMRFYAARRILKGEELFVNYGYCPIEGQDRYRRMKESGASAVDKLFNVRGDGRSESKALGEAEVAFWDENSLESKIKKLWDKIKSLLKFTKFKASNDGKFVAPESGTYKYTVKCTYIDDKLKGQLETGKTQGPQSPGKLGLT